MARVPLLDLEDVRGKPANVRRALANHDVGLAMFGEIGDSFKRGALDGRLRELALLQLSYAANNGYVFTHHVTAGRAVGITDADIDDMIADTVGTNTDLDEIDRLVLKATRDLTSRVRLDDATWLAIEGELGATAAMELVLLIGYYNYLVRFVVGLKVDLEAGFGYEELLDRFPSIDPADGWQ